MSKIKLILLANGNKFRFGLNVLHKLSYQIIFFVKTLYKHTTGGCVPVEYGDDGWLNVDVFRVLIKGTANVTHLRYLKKRSCCGGL